MQTDDYSRALFNLSFGSPVIKPSFQVSFMESPRRDSPFLQPSYIHHSKSPVYESPFSFQVPLGRKGAPKERDALIRSLS